MQFIDIQLPYRDSIYQLCSSDGKKSQKIFSVLIDLALLIECQVIILMRKRTNQ